MELNEIKNQKYLAQYLLYGQYLKMLAFFPSLIGYAVLHKEALTVEPCKKPALSCGTLVLTFLSFNINLSHYV